MTLAGDFQQLIDVQHWGIMMELDRQDPPRPAQPPWLQYVPDRLNHWRLSLGWVAISTTKSAEMLVPPGATPTAALLPLVSSL